MHCDCRDCPRMKEYIPVGPCPECGNPDLLMNTATHMALCGRCGVEWGLPMAIEGLCEENVRRKKYKIVIQGELSKYDILRIAKLVGITCAQLYRSCKEGAPVLNNLSYKQVMDMQKKSADNHLIVIPEIVTYENFYICWKYL